MAKDLCSEHAVALERHETMLKTHGGNIKALFNLAGRPSWTVATIIIILVGLLSGAATIAYQKSAEHRSPVTQQLTRIELLLTAQHTK